MPLIIPKTLPAYDALYEENVFVMHRERALAQHIRPLEILILNLMPTKIATETQIARLLANTPLQVHMTLLQTASHAATHVSAAHLDAFYKTFDEVKNNRYDGMIITGAPVETMDFEQVDYWPELCEIMDFSETNVYSTLHVCWGAQAGLYYHYGVHKELLPEKMFGVFEHRVTRPANPLVRGFDEVFYAPHSRHTGICREDVDNCAALRILAESDAAGPFLMSTENGRQIFVTGHPEYDKYTLDAEYKRDVAKGLAHPCARQLLPGRRPRKAAAVPLARPRPPAVRKLAQLLRLPEHPLRSGGYPAGQAREVNNKKAMPHGIAFLLFLTFYGLFLPHTVAEGAQLSAKGQILAVAVHDEVCLVQTQLAFFVQQALVHIAGHHLG